MKDGLFEEGDIIKGAKNNRYGVFNENLLEGKVLSTIKHDNPQFCQMRVLIVNHSNISYNGSVGIVANDKNRFELIEGAEKDFWESLEVL